MPLYSHVYTIAFSVESRDAEGEDVTPRLLRSELLRRIEDLDASEDWIEAVGPPVDSCEVDESVRPPMYFRVSVWDAMAVSATWYFNGIQEVNKAIEAAYAHGATRTEVQHVRTLPKGHCISDADGVLAWIKDQ